MLGEISRRQFFKVSAGGILSLYIGSRFHGFERVAQAAIPGGTIDLGTLPKFTTPMLIPPVMPKAATAGGVDYYEISMKQFQQQILPAGYGQTTVWGYGAVSGNGPFVGFHHAPSLTIEAMANKPVRVKWINDLKDSNGKYLPHLLPVDPTLHWANPPGGRDHSDTRPTFGATPSRYTGPVPMVTHVHGAVGVGDESDGYPEAWYLPNANDIPAGFATHGNWYEFFGGKAATAYGATWGPGFATFQYPNHNRAATIWYHDHSLGMTRLNVYAGPAGFYLIRGGLSGDHNVVDRRFGTPAVLPGPAPQEGDGSNKAYYEIPIAIQDRSFNNDGSLFYPESRTFFDEATAEDPGFIPDSDLSPIWNPEFFGNTIMVNGNTWPYQKVEQRRYRFRFLNGCQSRFLILDFRKIEGVEVWLIGNEGGFLPEPVDLTKSAGNRLLMGLAERADVIVDFTHVRTGDYVLRNVGPDEPFGGGSPGRDFEPADPATTGQIMQFKVVPAVAADPTTPPKFLALPALARLPVATTTRKLSLNEVASTVWDGPAEALLGVTDADGNPTGKMWMEEVSENPIVGDTEVWEMYNFTADAHPMHVHEVAFEVVNRQALVTNEEGETEVPARLVGKARRPEIWESGRKDMVIAYPGEVTRIKAQFNTPGQFVWHCHIVEHEDNEMMRPYRIGPEQSGQPESNMPA